MFGRRSYNDERLMRGQSPLELAPYLHSGHFIEATAENWESEFLQMAAFIWLSCRLFQIGSPESRKPGEKPEEFPVSADSPWPVHRGGWVLTLYENSLSLTLIALFIFSFFLHAYGGAMLRNEENQPGRFPITMLQYMGTSDFWFESFQNWQSEFLSIAAVVVLGIFLRQKGSPQSKPVQMPHHMNE